MVTQKPIEIIFKEDELVLMEVDPTWSQEELLTKKGVFYLKDLVKVLDFDPVRIKKKVKDCEAAKRSPWKEIGVRKVWSKWMVRMKVFANYYQKHLVPKVRVIESGWDGNTLLKQNGIFTLTDACSLIPFATHQLRYQAKMNPNSRKEYGVWKEPELNLYLVDMARFGPWVHRLWDGQFERK